MVVGSSLQDAAFVSWSGFVGVLIGEEDFDAGEVAVESIEKTVDLVFHRGGEVRVHGDVLVAVDQDLHGSFS